MLLMSKEKAPTKRVRHCGALRSRNPTVLLHPLQRSVQHSLPAASNLRGATCKAGIYFACSIMPPTRCALSPVIVMFQATSPALCIDLHSGRACERYVRSQLTELIQ